MSSPQIARKRTNKPLVSGKVSENGAISKKEKRFVLDLNLGSAPKMDSRVRRTRNQLGDAIIALMQEQPFDSITVQQILDRAGVQRSTFYSHFSDKNDLFFSDAEDFFELMSTFLTRSGDKSDRVAPVREFFAHVADVQPFLKSLIESGKFHDILDLAHGHFARSIEDRLAAMPATRGLSSTARAARAHGLAGAFLSIMTWWLNHKMPASPQQMDDLFHLIAWRGVASQTALPVSAPSHLKKTSKTA